MNKVLIVGSGNMGEAMLRGWIKASNELTKIYVREPNPSNWLKKMNDTKKITLNPLDIKGQINVCIFAVKPQVAEQVIKDNKNELADNSFLISVIAGKDFSFFHNIFKVPYPVIRVMPNTPSKVGLGVNAVFFDSMITDEQRDIFMNNFKESGKSFILESEDKIDLITPYSGSGPAYFFEIARILSNDLERRGMDKKDSLEIIALTMKGAAEMILVSEQDPKTLRENVTSKGGVTFEALKVLEENQLSTIMERAIDAALKRNSELKEV